jgi:hypothetical protein
MKKLFRSLIILVLSLFTLYLIFLSVISVSLGFVNSDRPGFWMPILCGFLLLFLDLYIIKLIVYLFKQAKAKEKYQYL